MDAQVKDDIILQSGPVVITRTLAKFGSTTYTINGIGSIYIGQKRNTLFLWIGTIATLAALIYFVSPDSNDRVLAITAAIIAVIAFVTYFGQQQFLMLSISSGDKEAYASGNYAFLQEIKAAIETAVTLRG